MKLSKAIERTVGYYVNIPRGIDTDAVLWHLLGRIAVLPADEESLLQDIQRSFDAGVKAWVSE